MRAFVGLLFGFILCLILTSFAGEAPVHVFLILTKSAFGTFYDLGLTLFYATSLVFTGLSVCIAFHAGLFNIGAEGQLTVGALAATFVGLIFRHWPFPLAPIVAAGAALLAGGLWGWIPGFLKAKFSSHEVIVTMMMNFIAAGVASYLVVGPLQNPESQNPESAVIGAAYRFQNWDPFLAWFPDTGVNSSLVIAIVLSIGLHFFLSRTIWGFELKAVGQSERAALLAGINASKVKTVAMTSAGAFAGLVALNEILGFAGKFRLGFSPDFGFIGIAVALLARNRPLIILVSAFLFGALQKGASDLDLETQFITRDFARILQSVIILSVIGFSILPLNFKKWHSWIRSR